MSRVSVIALAAIAALGISAAATGTASAATNFYHSYSSAKFSSALFGARTQNTFRPGSWVMLNPQPLPPKVLLGGARAFR